MNKKKWQPGENDLQELMTDHARREGQQLWDDYEAAVNQGNAPAPSRELDLVCREAIHEHFSDKKQNTRSHRALGTLSRWAACIVLVLGMLTATLLSADADSHIHIDRYLQNACSLSELKTRYIVHVRLFPGTENQNVDALSKVMAGLTAKGYSLQQEYVNHSATAERPATGLYSCYENAQGQQVRLNSRVPMSGIIIVYKQEGLYATQVEHLGYKMVLVEQSGSRQLYWLDDTEGLCYSLHTEGLSESEFWDLVYALAQV